MWDTFCSGCSTPRGIVWNKELHGRLRWDALIAKFFVRSLLLRSCYFHVLAAFVTYDHAKIKIDFPDMSI